MEYILSYNGESKLIEETGPVCFKGYSFYISSINEDGVELYEFEVDRNNNTKVVSDTFHLPINTKYRSNYGGYHNSWTAVPEVSRDIALLLQTINDFIISIKKTGEASGYECDTLEQLIVNDYLNENETTLAIECIIKYVKKETSFYYFEGSYSKVAFLFVVFLNGLYGYQNDKRQIYDLFTDNINVCDRNEWYGLNVGQFVSDLINLELAPPNDIDEYSSYGEKCFNYQFLLNLKIELSFDEHRCLNYLTDIFTLKIDAIPMPFRLLELEIMSHYYTAKASKDNYEGAVFIYALYNTVKNDANHSSLKLFNGSPTNIIYYERCVELIKENASKGDKEATLLLDLIEPNKKIHRPGARIWKYDIAFLVDVAGSMRNSLSNVKELIKGIILKTIDGLQIEHEEFDMRIKLITYGDIGERTPITETKFMDLYNVSSKEEIFSLIDTIEPQGKSGLSNGLEALAHALKSDEWSLAGSRRRHVFIIISDKPACRLGQRSYSPVYPKDMPKDLGELGDLWEGCTQTAGGTYQVKSGRLVVFAPNTYPWNDLTRWNRVWVAFSEAGKGLEDIELCNALDMFVLDDF